MKKRAFAYARTSKEDKGDPAWSIPTQLQRIEDRVSRDETMELVGKWDDRDQSGALPFEKRSNWPEIEKQLKSGDIVIVNDLSRFSRDKRQAEDKLIELLANGIDVLSLSMEGVDYATADGEMMTSMYLLFAHWQRKKIIENLRQCHWQMFLEGKALGCRPPLGYDYEVEGKVWSVNEEEAELVRRIFALKISGYGYQGIARKLTLEGIPTKRGGEWRTNTVKRIITSRWYIGEREYRGEIKVLDVPAIIERETWELAQASIRTQDHQPRGTYELSGLLHCTLCDSTLHRVRRWQDGRANGEADWRCPECGKMNIREHIVMPAVLEALFDHLDPERYQAALAEAQKHVKKGQGRLTTLRKRLGVVERKQGRLLDELARDDTTLTRVTFQKKNQEYQGEIDELEQAIQELEDRALLTQRPRVPGNLREDWETLDVLDKQATLRDFIERVDIISPNGVRGADRVAVAWRA